MTEDLRLPWTHAGILERMTTWDAERQGQNCQTFRIFRRNRVHREDAPYPATRLPAALTPALPHAGREEDTADPPARGDPVGFPRSPAAAVTMVSLAGRSAPRRGDRP